MINVIAQWFPLLVSSLLAFWIYSLSKKCKQAYEKVFETVEFCGQKYACVHWEEDYFMLRVIRFMNAVKQGNFGILYKDKVPLMALLPIEEFYRLKTIEEHLEDQEIGKIIVNFTPKFPAISLLCFHVFHKHVSTYFTQSFHLETRCEMIRNFL